MEVTQSFARKLAHIIFSLMVSLIAGNIILIPFVILAGTGYVSNLPDIAEGIIYLSGALLSISFTIMCFRRLYRYINRGISL